MSRIDDSFGNFKNQSFCKTFSTTAFCHIKHAYCTIPLLQVIANQTPFSILDTNTNVITQKKGNIFLSAIWGKLPLISYLICSRNWQREECISIWEITTEKNNKRNNMIRRAVNNRMIRPVDNVNRLQPLNHRLKLFNYLKKTNGSCH